jgi:hypothetical protein
MRIQRDKLYSATAVNTLGRVPRAASRFRKDEMINRRSAFRLAILLVFAIAAAVSPARAQQEFTKAQMIAANIAAGLGAEGWDIEKMVQVPPSHVEVLESKGGLGWRLAELKLANGSFTAVWVSPPFNLNYINVASKEDFKLVQAKKFVGVTFNGCPPHLCDDHVGIYLHVIGQRQGFEADIDGQNIVYSQNVWDPKNRAFFAWLSDQVNSFMSAQPAAKKP